MIDRICISINNKCNLSCDYCHFSDKGIFIAPDYMDVYKILFNVRKHINKNNLKIFKIGFVGNGEPLLDYESLKDYVMCISDLIDDGIIKPYTITNGILVDEEKLLFFKEHSVDVGFSLDGNKTIHDKYRCHSFDLVMESIDLYYKVYGTYPSMNCTIGPESLLIADSIISFFKQFNNRVTFSRMIGKYAISLDEFNGFMNLAKKSLNVRTGGYDCTMYGGLCGAGLNNIFYSNGKAYICGNCIDKQSLPYDLPLDEMNFDIPNFDRKMCFKETVLK